MHRPGRTALSPKDSLLTALQRMSAAGRDELVVVDAADETRPVGTLTHPVGGDPRAALRAAHTGAGSPLMCQ